MLNIAETHSIVFQEQPLSWAEQACHDQAMAAARSFRESEASLLLAVKRVEEARLFEKFGLQNTFQYCMELLKLTEDVAGNLIRVLRKSREVPELLDAVVGGRLTISKVRPVLSVLTAETQGEWLGKAERLSRAQLEKQVAVANPQTLVRERVKPVAPELYEVTLALSEEELQNLRRLQDLACQAKGEQVGLSETLSKALKFAVEKLDPVRKASRARKSTSTGRQIPAALRRQVTRRDKGRCQAISPQKRKCLNSRWTHLHHIVPVSEGGPHTAENLITLCAHHHRLWHRAETRPGTG